MNHYTPKKRGGPQPGSGPKPKDPKDKVVKCYISMTQAHHAATEGDRSGMIRRALEFEAKYKDIVEAFIKTALQNGVSIKPHSFGETPTYEIVLTTRNVGLVSRIQKFMFNEIEKR